jgi:hypothetical protein
VARCTAGTRKLLANTVVEVVSVTSAEVGADVYAQGYPKP